MAPGEKADGGDGADQAGEGESGPALSWARAPPQPAPGQPFSGNCFPDQELFVSYPDPGNEAKMRKTEK